MKAAPAPIRGGYRVFRGLRNAGSTFSRFTSRFSFRLSFGSFFAFPPRGAFPDMKCTLPFFSWRVPTNLSPFPSKDTCF